MLLLGGTFLCTLLASGDISAGGNEIVVVVNDRNTMQKLTKAELRRIFQTSKSAWDDGTPINALNLPEGNDLRVAFDKAVLGLEGDDVAKFWTDRKIRGGARPPRKVTSTSAVTKTVSSDSGAIGYVKADEVRAGMRKVATVRGSDVL